MKSSLESHVIPAKAGIQFVAAAWTPTCTGVTKPMTFISVGGLQAHVHSEWPQSEGLFSIRLGSTAFLLLPPCWAGPASALPRSRSGE